ncbi:galactose mutarotase-like domain-containing protein [Mycotypha africana]|uniref:galactose mutarotase-like domain-containing protein n=1 Tax=Mycotypha africana TaxID=64632 RepID=UPI0022FFCCD5|nr:galactose mutarotase-like domain-containing protein [Mycotypha africana]KAI8992140.1 galactose mutarotase-like domain-containing protein [Mycotypha africana]
MAIYGHRHSNHADDSFAPALDNAPRVPLKITKSRINNFVASSGQFYSMGIHRALWVSRTKGSPHVQLKVYSVPGLKEAVAQNFESFTIGQHKFGPSWSTHWFHVVATLPQEMEGKEVVFQWDMGCEGMVWSKDGVPQQGLTGGTDQPRHEYILTNRGSAGAQFEFYIEAACNGMFGVGAADSMVANPNKYFELKRADLVVPNKRVQKLYHDLTVIRGIAYDTESTSSRARQALWVLNEVINNFIAEDKEAVQKCLDLTKEYLSAKNGSGEHHITAVGNCHIDTAWLWPYDETKRKIARSWSSQLDLLNRYPEYIFTGSQVQQYEWLKELYPAVFEKILKAEKTGQWEIIGGSWVEHGCLIVASPYDINIGYSGQLPQILRESGCDYFFTQKLSWNNINTFPLTTFWWTGIDDSRILAHLTPAETYTASVTPAELHKCIENHHDLEVSNQSLLVFGHGDGGGGPAPEMLERLERMKNVDGLPTVSYGSATNFFESIEKTSDRLQAYKGELYLEFHRGTYTTQALVKKGNRKGEVIIRDVEMLAVYAKLHANAARLDFSYPSETITRLWKLLCLNQFHDCLPGSAINLAYVDVHKFHREVIQECSILRHGIQTFLIRGTSESKGELITDDEEDGVVVFNTLPWPRSEVILVPEKNTNWTNQQTSGDYEYYTLVKNVPSLGASGYKAKVDFEPVSGDHSAKAYTQNGNFVLENLNLKAVFNKDGQLLELYDKTSARGNLVAEKKKANVLQLYEDVPTYWDAWDVEIYHLQKYVTLEGQNSLKILSDGPLKAELQFEHTISKNSSIKQIISLTCIGDRIEFDNVVEWHESHQFLKVEFNWDLITDYATYDIQYGVIRRPTHYNTTVDYAKFEVCGHKFADLSESNYGVAILNDCKYGYATHGGTQRLSLLRSPKGPDEHADMGQHSFKYAIYPHKGNFTSSNVMQCALDFNVPLLVRYIKTNDIRSGEIIPSLFEIAPSDQIIIDTVKLAEDDDGQGKVIILRLYEAYGGKSMAILRSPLNIKRIQISNVLEDDTGRELQKEQGGFAVKMRAFQVLSLKVELQ